MNADAESFYWSEWATPQSAISHKFVWHKIIERDDNLSRYPVLATKWIMMEIPLAIEKAEDSSLLRTAWNGDSLRLLRLFYQAAAAECIKMGLPDDSSRDSWQDANEASMIFEEAKEIYDCIKMASFKPHNLRGDDWDHRDSLTNFLSPDIDRVIYSHGDYPTWNIGAIGEVASDYIKSRFKSPDLDRFLLTLLVNAEAVTYVDEIMSDHSVITGRPSLYQQAASRLDQKRHWRTYLLIKVALSVGVAVVAHPIWEGLISSENYNFVPWVISGVSLLSSLWMVTETLDKLECWRAAEGSGVFDQIGFFRYCEHGLKGVQLVSISHIRGMLLESRKFEVYFPTSLYALLDDIEARGLISV